MSKKDEIAKFHRKNILEAATVLFHEKGINKTTMDDIAKKAEYSKATIYVYYRSKEELVNAMTLESMKQFKEAMEEIAGQEKDVVEVYHTICMELEKEYTNNPVMVELLLGKINVDIENPDTPGVFREIYEEGEILNQILYQLIEKGIQKCVFRKELDVKQVIMYLWGSLSAMIKMANEKQEYIKMQFGLSKEEFLEKQYSLVLQAIRR